MNKPIGIHWFRYDLRLKNNPSLSNLSKKVDKVIPIFIFDPDENIGSTSRWWLEKSLINLQKSITNENGTLNIFYGNPQKIISQIVTNTKINFFSWNRLYDPYSIKRDTEIKSFLSSHKIECNTFNGYLLNEPWNVKNKSGSFFKVFTPYWKNCSEIINNRAIQSITKIKNYSKILLEDSKEIKELNLIDKNQEWLNKIENNWSPGEDNAHVQLKKYISKKANNYGVGRDRPDKDLTSKLSPYLHFGEISCLQVYNDLQKSNNIDNENKRKFLSEIGWRDFSYNLIYHYPDMTNNPIQKKFKKFPWLKDNKSLSKWQKGTTGIPIVDAGMRQLYEVGWMHNRVRMIVGSFLTKNLLLHWKHGQQWFFDTLVDADIGSNTAGWQWISGCGADASPYFRIFNPVLQGQKFDPDGEYVKKFIPELSKVSKKFVHNPWDMSTELQSDSQCIIGKDYPAPIVDLKETRNRALLAFKSIS